MISIEKLYIATVAEDALDLAREYGVGLELDQFCTAANMDGEAFATWDASARLAVDAAQRHVLHAPFAELYPAAVDPQAAALARGRLLQAWGVAAGYGIRRMVVHAGFLPQVYHPEWFVKQGAAFFRDLLGALPDECTLLIENVLEDEPRLLADLLAAIGDPRAQVCLDIGHAHMASAQPLRAWVDVLSPYIGHVHLHNNDGTGDAHGGLAEGTLPVWQVLDALAEKAPMATYTLEMAVARPSLEALLAQNAAQQTDAPLAMLRQYFGYDSFREGQRPLIDALLAGQDALGIMPTGAGKSACFQIPALLREGTALVISPLISLMKDQVTALNQSGVRAAFLNSSLTERQMTAALRNAEAGAYKLIYVAPERLLTERFLYFAMQARISLIAVDEAHCISQWGQDFRPSYLDIPAFVQRLPHRPPVSAFTATATPQVREDIMRLLALQSPALVQTGFDRPNLHFAVMKPRHKDATLRELVADRRGQSGIIYCATRKNVEKVCATLQASGVAATRYHAGLSDEERRRNQEDFSFDRCPVIVATNAFGMGIDKSNVRFIIHYNMPKDLESYYQEAGRAGRDGDAADCVLLYSGQDVQIQKLLIDADDGDIQDAQLREQTREKAYRRLDDMVRYCRAPQCLRQMILRYFGETMVAPCGHCGNCEAARDARDMTDEALPVLRAVAARQGRFGLGVLLEMLRGRATQKVRQYHLEGDALFGALSHLSGPALAAIGEQLLAEDYLRTKAGKYPVVMLGPRAESVLDDGEVVLLQVEEEAAPVRRSRRARADGLDRPEADAPVGDPGLFEALRVARMQLAGQLGVPAFVVFSDATLRDMSARVPRTRAELLQVKGVGEAKLDQFGDAFLRAIEEYMHTQDVIWF